MTRRIPDSQLADCLHLNPVVWQKVNRLLVRKALSEFAHEGLITPSAIGAGQYQIHSDDAQITYTFKATILSLNHWHIPLDSIVKQSASQTLPLDALLFMIELRETLKLKPNVLPVYLDEISSTLYGSAYKHDRNAPTALELIDADFQVIETAMSEGHPCFVANNGRLGFDANDYLRYAPEAAHPFQIVWLAVHKERATLSLSETLNYNQLIEEELGAAQLIEFNQQLSALGLDANDYWLMPAHPWQWQNKLSMAFAAEIAQRQIVFLGQGEDLYLAQQSIRAFFNLSAPHKRYVKTALSVLNMGFMRGLSPYYMLATPAINDWVYALVEGDAYLQSKGFHILREVAAIGYRNPYYEAAMTENNAYKKMLAALWRECPLTHLREGEKLMTMTALVHLDNHGRALVAELIQASGVSVDRWINDYLEAYFAPLLHCFYQHDLIYMPHGENLILVLKSHQVARVLMKDIAEEVGILNPAVELPELMQRVSTHIPDEMKTLCLFIDVFDGYLRHLAAILADQCQYSAEQFWHAVARCTHRYQASQPQLQAQFARYDLFADDFAHSCLNRLQMANNTHMLNLEDPASGLQMAGRLINPLAQWRDPASTSESQ
ncbi:IucA/IucC family siderophore biosynthesis protein [uncultured Deefgea sp.]|uniref:IucA/IucC family protein n=1 Tax=uncultured Deefgea sp. TaxID=1304914 RepID=UPI00262579EF|nr:IucA/IucC family siderophore biosynthesis protein [uncultured Deefgea sp.]